MTDSSKEAAMGLIKSNIEKSGWHIYVVSGNSPLPRFAYTIGVSEKIGVEVIFAGALFFSLSEVVEIINKVSFHLVSNRRLDGADVFFDSLGSFSIRRVHPSWSSQLMIGGADYYKNDALCAVQIVPDNKHWTLDIPNLEMPWNSKEEPVWQWLREPWTYDVPSESTAVTNLAALRGSRITEAARWEDSQWELFSGCGPEVSKEEIRVVSLGTLLALDRTLEAVTRLDVGRALWRDFDYEDWQKWN